MNIAVIGAQFGDEGKGKIVEYLICQAVKRSDKQVINYRWQGGANAGHTVKIGSETYKLHQLPSGIVRKGTFSLLGAGMYLNPRKLKEEIDSLRSRGIEITPDNLGISSQAHVTLDFHLREDSKNFNKPEHTSTGNGIRQTARDKADRIGLRFAEFIDRDLFAQIMIDRKDPDLFAYGGVDSLISSYTECVQSLSGFVVSEQEIFSRPHKYAIGEGAQGVLLDVDYGLYPGVTSSNPAIVPHRPDRIVAAFKSYVSSVGMGDRAFVTRMDSILENRLVPIWQEIGTTTGKARHLGWFDAVAGKYAIAVSQADTAVLTCLDRLETLHELQERPQIAHAYGLGDTVHNDWIALFDKRNALARVEPVYHRMPSWKRTMKEGQLNLHAKSYVEMLEHRLGMNFSMIGTGPEHSNIIIVEDLLD